MTENKRNGLIFKILKFWLQLKHIYRTAFYFGIPQQYCTLLRSKFESRVQWCAVLHLIGTARFVVSVPVHVVKHHSIPAKKYKRFSRASLFMRATHKANIVCKL